MERDRMLENPQDESVVRWGNEGDSFVVLEVRRALFTRTWELLTQGTEREVHEAHPPQAFQAQQLRQLRAPAEQIRLPQSAPQQ